MGTSNMFSQKHQGCESYYLAPQTRDIAPALFVFLIGKLLSKKRKGTRQEFDPGLPSIIAKKASMRQQLTPQSDNNSIYFIKRFAYFFFCHSLLINIIKSSEIAQRLAFIIHHNQLSLHNIIFFAWTPRDEIFFSLISQTEQRTALDSRALDVQTLLRSLQDQMKDVLCCCQSFVRKKKVHIIIIHKNKKKNSMFRNILSLQKRHSTLANRRQSDSNGKRKVKSIENLKINQINTANSKNEQNIPAKKDQRRMGEKSTFLRLDPNAYVKSGAKETMKLQITPFYQRITLSTANSLDNSVSNQIRQKIQKEIVPQIADSYQSGNKSANCIIFHKENFVKLLHKIFCLFLNTEEQQQDKTGKSLLNVKSLIVEANKSTMIKNHQIVAAHDFKLYQRSIKDNIPRRRLSLERLSCKKQSLSQEYTRLLQKKEDMNEEICVCTKKLSELKQQKTKIQEEINQREMRLASITQRSKYILTYVQDQNRNKIIKVAGKHFKAIQADIHDYAASLHAIELSTVLNHEPASENLQQLLKQLKKTLLQNSQLSTEEKFKMMRDLVLSLRETLKKKDKQQQRIIQVKTKCIITFVEKMKKWLENWNIKQDYLVNLRNQFSVDSEAFQASFNDIFGSKDDIKEPAGQQLFHIYLKLKQNYLMGNSFY